MLYSPVTITPDEAKLSWNNDCSEAFSCLGSYQLQHLLLTTKYLCIQSTKVYVPLSELGLLQPLSRKRVCPPPPDQRVGGGAHSPAAKGVGEVQFRRLEKKLSTLPTLCYWHWHRRGKWGVEGVGGTGEVRKSLQVCFTTVVDPGEAWFSCDRAQKSAVETCRYRKVLLDIS